MGLEKNGEERHRGSAPCPRDRRHMGAGTTTLLACHKVRFSGTFVHYVQEINLDLCDRLAFVRELRTRAPKLKKLTMDAYSCLPDLIVSI